MSTPTREYAELLHAKRDALKTRCENFLLERRNCGVENLAGADAAKFAHMTADLADLEARSADYDSELARVGHYPGNLAAVANRAARAVSSAGRLSPLAFDPEEMRAAHGKIGRGETAVLESRDFTSADPLLPAQLFPVPTFPRHEDRLLDRLPGFALDAPSLEYIQVNSVTGAAGIVGEGQPKPELQLPAMKLIVTALKLAIHAGVSWESISDFSAYTSAVQNELLRQVVDLENNQIVYGNPASGGLNGMLYTTGIVVFNATGTTASPPNNFDDVAGAIAALRTGPALAEPDLLCLHPDTWAAIRTQKDLYGRYLASADPTSETVESIWGVDVLVSTAFLPGDGILLDTQLFGRVAVRESLVMRMGYGVVGGVSDFTANIVRWLAEERLNVAVERPAAICHIKGLPTAAPTTAEATGTKAKR
jgi:hypothetical protein